MTTAPSAALRPPASRSRPGHRGRRYRHGSRGPSLDGPWVARQGTEVVVSLDVTDLRAPELQQEILRLRRRVKKLTALLRLALALLRSSGFMLTHERLPDGRAKMEDLAGRGSCPCVCSVGGTPAVPAIVPESVPCLANSAARVCARRRRPVRTTVVERTRVLQGAPGMEPTRGQSQGTAGVLQRNKTTGTKSAARRILLAAGADARASA